ncbi:MAG TPA: hypothetical protein VGP19_15270 [Candidatus Acidoferrales bacterium]|jgi:hypothetical protein|nr:hypothetical protein [Candidatus Acidoferrales bacterium]
MRVVVTCFSLVLSTALIVGAPAQAMPEKLASAPIGVVMETSRGRIGTDMAPEGAAIYDGDLLETHSDMTLEARVGKSQIFLQSSSSAEIRRLANGFSADLLNGTIAITSAEGETFQVRADGAIIRPIGIEPAALHVTRVSASAMLLSSSRGRFEVSMGSQVSTLEPGASYRMEIEPDETAPDDNPPPAGSQGNSRPHSAAHNRFIWIAIPAAGVVAGIIVWRALVSPSAP